MAQQWYWGYGAPPSGKKPPLKKKGPELPRMSNGRWFKPIQPPVQKKAHNCTHVYCGQCGIKNRLPKTKMFG
jgi:hypothetical protein